MSNNKNEVKVLTEEELDRIKALIGIKGYKLPSTPKVSRLETKKKSLKENYGIVVTGTDKDVYDAHNQAENELLNKLYNLTTRKTFLGLSETEQRDFVRSNSKITDDKYLELITENLYDNLCNPLHWAGYDG